MLIDSQAYGNNRKITAFVGGLDLCDGRYDTPEHRLFRDLDTVFKEDYHQPTFPVSGVFFSLALFYSLFRTSVHLFLSTAELHVMFDSIFHL